MKNNLINRAWSIEHRAIFKMTNNIIWLACALHASSLHIGLVRSSHSWPLARSATRVTRPNYNPKWTWCQFSWFFQKILQFFDGLSSLHDFKHLYLISLQLKALNVQIWNLNYSRKIVSTPKGIFEKLSHFWDLF